MKKGEKKLIRNAAINAQRSITGVQYKVRLVYHSVCPLVGIGTFPTPLSPVSVPLSQNRGGGHSPAGEELGESQFRRLVK